MSYSYFPPVNGFPPEEGVPPELPKGLVPVLLLPLELEDGNEPKPLELLDPEVEGKELPEELRMVFLVSIIGMVSWRISGKVP